MSWNLELAVLPSTDNLALSFYVPDVLGPTGKIVGFEDATSAAIVPYMCAGRIGDRVIDVGCRIVAAGTYFLESMDAPVESAYLYRITDYPVEVVIENGVEKLRTQGAPELLELFDGPKEVVDKEEAALLALKARTGLDFPYDFWVEYEEFGPD